MDGTLTQIVEDLVNKTLQLQQALSKVAELEKSLAEEQKHCSELQDYGPREEIKE